MVQFLITVHKMLENGFFEACKVRLVFDMVCFPSNFVDFIAIYGSSSI